MIFKLLRIVRRDPRAMRPKRTSAKAARVNTATIGLALLAMIGSLPLTLGPAFAKEVSDDADERRARAFVNAFTTWAQRVGAEQGAIAVLRAGELADAGSIGGRSPGEPTAIASLSKAITGICVSRLVDAGRLRYETTIGDALQNYFARAGYAADRRLEGITITQLLTHRSGIVRKVDGPENTSEISAGMRSPLEEKVRRTLKVPLEFAPGSKFAYSNSGYIVLSLIIEQISGRSYESQCNESVFAPIGVTSAHIGNSVAARGRSGAGGWQVSTIDYARFLTLVDRRSPAMGPLTQQWIAARDQDTPAYGLGFWTKTLANGQRVIEHNGLLATPDTSASAQYVMFPGAWIVALNVTPARPKAIAELTTQLEQIGMEGIATVPRVPAGEDTPRHSESSIGQDAAAVCIQGSWVEDGGQKRYVCLSWRYRGLLYTPEELEQVLAAQQASPAPQSRHMEYRGYRINLSQVADRDDTSRIVASVKGQIDLVEDLQIKPEIKAFFRSVPITLSTDIRGEGRYSSEGGLVMMAKADMDDRPILLHEFLHAFHFDRLPNGRQNQDIITFYRRAKNVSAYAKNSYMLKNPAEFFAMSASAFLYGRVARPPHSRETVVRSQPIYARYLATLFGFQSK